MAGCWRDRRRARARELHDRVAIAKLSRLSSLPHFLRRTGIHFVGKCSSIGRVASDKGLAPVISPMTMISTAGKRVIGFRWRRWLSGCGLSCQHHRQNQPERLGKAYETVGFIEACDCVVQRVHDDHRRAHGAGARMGTVESIRYQDRAEPTALRITVDSQSPDQRRADERISRNMFAGCRRNVSLRHSKGAERIVAKNAARRVSSAENENRVRLTAEILLRLSVEIAIEACDTRREGGSVVPVVERPDAQVRQRHVPLSPRNATRML